MFDLLLEWCSERGDGPLRSFRDAHDWLAQRSGIDSEWALALYSFQILGHLEVDANRGTWAVAPAVITSLDDSGGNALLVGARPRWLMQRLLTLHVDPDPIVEGLSMHIMLYEPHIQKDAPSAHYLTSPDDDTMRELCTRVGMRFEHRVAMRLREALPGIDSYLQAGSVAAAPPGIETRRFDGVTLRWEDVDDDSSDGTYEYRGYGVPRYQHVAGGSRFEVDKGTAIFSEVRRIDRQVVFYAASRQVMFVPGRTPLPMLAARCAVLRTGLLPSFVHRPISLLPDQTRLNRYENIPPLTYDAICGSLGQDPSRGLLK